VSLDRTLSALSDPTRRGVVLRLRREPCRAGALADEFQVSAPVMSRHLRVLRLSGLIEEAAQGEDARVRVYRLRREPFEAMRTWLEEVEGYWALELGAFKEHAERTRGKGGRRE